MSHKKIDTSQQKCYGLSIKDTLSSLATSQSMVAMGAAWQNGCCVLMLLMLAICLMLTESGKWITYTFIYTSLSFPISVSHMCTHNLSHWSCVCDIGFFTNLQLKLLLCQWSTTSTIRVGDIMNMRNTMFLMFHPKVIEHRQRWCGPCVSKLYMSKWGIYFYHDSTFT